MELDQEQLDRAAKRAGIWAGVTVVATSVALGLAILILRLFVGMLTL